MATLSNISIINSNTVVATPVESGLERTLCSPRLCDSINLTVYRRTVVAGRQFELQAGADYHVVYIMQGSANGLVHFSSQTHVATEGAGAVFAVLSIVAVLSLVNATALMILGRSIVKVLHPEST